MNRNEFKRKMNEMLNWLHCNFFPEAGNIIWKKLQDPINHSISTEINDQGEHFIIRAALDLINSINEQLESLKNNNSQIDYQEDYNSFQDRINFFNEFLGIEGSSISQYPHDRYIEPESDTDMELSSDEKPKIGKKRKSTDQAEEQKAPRKKTTHTSMEENNDEDSSDINDSSSSEEYAINAIYLLQSRFFKLVDELCRGEKLKAIRKDAKFGIKKISGMSLDKEKTKDLLYKFFGKLLKHYNLKINGSVFHKITHKRFIESAKNILGDETLNNILSKLPSKNIPNIAEIISEKYEVRFDQADFLSVRKQNAVKRLQSILETSNIEEKNKKEFLEKYKKQIEEVIGKYPKKSLYLSSQEEKKAMSKEIYHNLGILLGNLVKKYKIKYVPNPECQDHSKLFRKVEEAAGQDLSFKHADKAHATLAEELDNSSSFIQPSSSSQAPHIYEEENDNDDNMSESSSLHSINEENDTNNDVMSVSTPLDYYSIDHVFVSSSLHSIDEEDNVFIPSSLGFIPEEDYYMFVSSSLRSIDEEELTRGLINSQEIPFLSEDSGGCSSSYSSGCSSSSSGTNNLANSQLSHISSEQTEKKEVKIVENKEEQTSSSGLAKLEHIELADDLPEFIKENIKYVLKVTREFMEYGKMRYESVFKIDWFSDSKSGSPALEKVDQFDSYSKDKAQMEQTESYKWFEYIPEFVTTIDLQEYMQYSLYAAAFISMNSGLDFSVALDKSFSGSSEIGGIVKEILSLTELC